MRDYFQLERHQTRFSTEIVAGLTTFLTVSYILTVNPIILADAGMPRTGVFAATAVSAAICTLFMALYANAPFAVAPGMGLNAFFAYTVCHGLGFHWREALAVTFLAGCVHFLLMTSPFRKTVVQCIPSPLKYATTVGIGLFISYVGLKNAGFVQFTIPSDSYTVDFDGAVIANASAVPSMIGHYTAAHLVAAAGLAITVYLFGLEKRTGDSYGAFLIGIVAATFVGIPLGVTNLEEMRMLDLATVGEMREVAFGFFGSPGLGSLTDSPVRLAYAALMVLILSLTDVLDSIASIVGTGRLRGQEIFTDDDLVQFRLSGRRSRLDRALVANSVAGGVAALTGCCTATVYIESVTGVAAGGRTGLTALVVGVLFILCLPLIGFFRVIPQEAAAAALLLSGICLMSLVADIEWSDVSESVPAGLTIVFMCLTYSILNGMTAGFVSHIVLQAALGRLRRVHPMFLVVTGALVAAALLGHFLDLNLGQG